MLNGVTFGGRGGGFELTGPQMPLASLTLDTNARVLWGLPPPTAEWLRQGQFGGTLAC